MFLDGYKENDGGSFAFHEMPVKQLKYAVKLKHSLR